MKPNYSNIAPIAYECKSPEERAEIIEQLKEWGVPIQKYTSDEFENGIYTDSYEFPNLAYNDRGFLALYRRLGGCFMNKPLPFADSRDSFLAPFREAWESAQDEDLFPMPEPEEFYSDFVVSKEKYDQLKNAFEELLAKYHLDSNEEHRQLVKEWKQKAGIE